MTHARSLKAIALAAALSFAMTACGQKPGIHVSGAGGTAVAGDGSATGAAQGDGAVAGPTDGDQAALGDGSTVDDGTAGGTTDTDDSGSGTGSSTTTSASGDASGSATTGGDSGSGSGGDGQDDGGDTAGGDGGQQLQASGTDRTGVADDAINLAMHAPVTGAAPLPTTSFEQSGDLYWRYVTEIRNESVLGRSKVHVEFADDKYDPNSARQVCRELEAKSFLLVGGGGTDQIQACGQFAAVSKIPYFSAGVTENGLEGNPWYFASSMTYRQQGQLLANYVKRHLTGKKAAAIITDTPNFDDAQQGWEQGVQAAGLPYYKTLKHPKGDTSWYAAFAQDLKSNGVEVVYINSSPVDYIRFAQKASEQGFKPQYIGVGITMGLNAVLGSGCDYVDNGIFFSPFPGLDYARQRVPEFFDAGKKLGKPTDDIALALWGIAAQQHELFTRYGDTFGNDLTREDFRALTEAQGSISGKVFPEVGYSSQNHFGGKQVHVLQADCSSGEYKTLDTFKSGF